MIKEKSLSHHGKRKPSNSFPKMRKGTLKKDRSKYYGYHKDHGHDTEECIHLKEKIEDLIRLGHLKNFFQGQNQKGWKFEKKGLP